MQSIQQPNNYGTDLDERLPTNVGPLYRLRDVIFQSLRVATPAVVIAFDAEAATVTVLIGTCELVRQNQSKIQTILDIGTGVSELPVLTDVPVQFAQGGGWNLTFPIREGDECLLVFSDTSLDAWFQQGTGAPANPVPVAPFSTRRHSIRDAVAVFGLRSTPRSLANYSTTSAQLRNDAGNVCIDLAPSQITVKAHTVTVNATGDATVTAENATVTASADAKVQGESVEVMGSSSVTIGDNVTIDSKLFLQHKHSGVQTGGGVSGPVV